MPKDLTQRGYPLPHPDNIAAEDVGCIRETLLQVDADISAQEKEQNTLKHSFERFAFETFLNLWGPHDHC
jgi:hypothetical protein